MIKSSELGMYLLTQHADRLAYKPPKRAIDSVYPKYEDQVQDPYKPIVKKGTKYYVLGFAFFSISKEADSCKQRNGWIRL